MRKTLIAGNWKMNKAPAEAEELIEQIRKKVGDVTHIDVVVCPPYPALCAVYEKIKQSHIKLGAQDLFWEREGAYTGEISALMLRETGCKYVIVGHSERRIYFGETDETVNRKIKAALQWNLVPIVCVGEKLEERERNEMEDVVRKQMGDGLKGLSARDVSKIVIAYEPIWAIGTGKTATPAQANQMHSFIRQIMTGDFSEQISSRVRILYGGSVKPDNISQLVAEDHIDGALVGGASLDDDSFAEIVTKSMG